MAFPGRHYAPPGVFVETNFENPLSAALDSLKLPVLIGEGNEFLTQVNLEVVRGSSANVDQQVVKEDEAGRAVVTQAASGSVTTRGVFDGVLTKFQTVNFPIVNGKGTGTTTTSRNDVAVTINGESVVVLSVDGTNGVVELAQAPKVGDSVLCTYFFNRTDTLATDDVSDQVTSTNAIIRAETGIGDSNAANPDSPAAVLNLHADILNISGEVVTPANNVLVLTVDGTDHTITVPPKTNYTMAEVAVSITAAAAGTLTASTFTNNFGKSALMLTADHDIVVKEASANAPLGLATGQASNRRKTFYTFHGPIVDGTNGGVTTTDTSHVTVKVDGVQVIPTSVDGATRAVTLSQAPKAGAVVTIAYWHNTWQDTFDYLAHTNITAVDACGEVPDASTFISGADFVLQDDRILWGSAATVKAGVNTAGKEFFDSTQITTTLVDDRTFMSACTAVTASSGGVSSTSKTDWTLPFAPTLGNGRSTSLGQSLFQSSSNNRIDLPVNRPDVVKAYWGYGVQDALDRGEVKVTKVEGQVITLAEEVPVGASVYATFYHSLLTDKTYTLTNTLAGGSGVGTYTVKDSGSTDIFNAAFSTGTKGSSLTGVAIEWPSGSELTPDIHFEGVGGSKFKGPKEEIVTVRFENRTATPAKYAMPGAGPYELINDKSDKLYMKIDSIDLAGAAAGIDLRKPGAHGGGFFTSVVGQEIAYTGGPNAVVGTSYDLTTQENIDLTIDGVQVTARVPAANNKDITHFVASINEEANGHSGVADADGVTTSDIEFAAGSRSAVDDYYNGWKVVVGNATTITDEQERTITDYNGTTGIATVDSAWLGGDQKVDQNDTYYVYNPATMAVIKGATKFTSPVTLTNTKHDSLKLIYQGTTATATLTLDLVAVGPDTYNTAADLAAHIQTKMDAAIAAAVGGGNNNLKGCKIYCEADADSRLQFKVRMAPADTACYIQFMDAASAAADFAILAGLDTAAQSGANGGQAALVVGPVARAWQPSTGGDKLYDRLVLRNRILPGGGSSSMTHHNVLAQCQLLVGAGSGNTKAGLLASETGEAGGSAVVEKASLASVMPQAGGLDANGELQVTLYDGTGAQAANDQFVFTMDGVSVTVNLGGSAAGTTKVLGPISTNGTILKLIVDAMVAVSGSPFGDATAVMTTNKLVRQEGLGIRLTSGKDDETSGVVIGSGSANAALGFTSGASSVRELVSPKRLASGLNAHYHGTFNTWLTTSTSQNTYFGDEAIAWTSKDPSNAEHLYLQSKAVGAASAIQLRNATAADALFYGTGLGSVHLDGAVGEAALSGFYVSSDQPNGSGTANESVLSNTTNGAGQDGVVGQTYRDKVTGLTFTIMPRGWSSNQTGPWANYPTGANATFRINVSKTFTTDANLPNKALGGVELKVANTTNVGVSDTAIVQSYKRTGSEPAIGDLYYASYTYKKDNYTTSFFTKLSAVEKAFGAISPDAPLSLGSYLALINGAVIVGCKQVERATGSNYASTTDYRNAIEELEGALPGQARPDIVIPLRGDSTDLFQVLRKSNEKMSSIRYRSERTSIIGMSSGSTVAEAKALAGALNSERMRLVYPDMATIEVVDAQGTATTQLVDGPMLAAAMAGSVVSPNVDVATPWTNRRLVGFTQLARKLDAVEMNQVAQAGITVLEDRVPYLKVRHGLTTFQDTTNKLKSVPTVQMIADHVQQQSRAVLESFIGLKMLPSILSQIEGRLAMLLKSMVAAQIIQVYTGVSASVAADDPTVVEVEAWYSPVFPLLYIHMRYNVRTSR